MRFMIIYKKQTMSQLLFHVELLNLKIILETQNEKATWKSEVISSAVRISVLN